MLVQPSADLVQHHLVIVEVLVSALFIQGGGPLVHLGHLQAEAAGGGVLALDPSHDLVAQPHPAEGGQEEYLLDEHTPAPHLGGVALGQVEVAHRLLPFK